MLYPNDRIVDGRLQIRAYGDSDDDGYLKNHASEGPYRTRNVGLTMIGSSVMIWPVTSKTITHTDTVWVIAPASAAAPAVRNVDQAHHS